MPDGPAARFNWVGTSGIWTLWGAERLNLPNHSMGVLEVDVDC
jgi:hypothetical protein